MSILLVRHGEAVAATAGDRERYLTLRGRAETLAVGKRLAEMGHVPTAIVTSPLVRAVQTAEILGYALAFDGIVSTDASLEPDADPAVALPRIPGGPGLTLVVCHEPIVRGLAALLARQPSFAPFRTSGAVLFEGTRVVLRLEP